MIMKAAVLGCSIEAPAASEYAVLPVGVATMMPSACAVVILKSLRYISICVRYGETPRSTVTSFIHTKRCIIGIPYSSIILTSPEEKRKAVEM